MNISTIISFYTDYTRDIQLHNYDMVYDVIKQSTSPACSSRLYHHDSLPGDKQNKTDVPLSLKQSNILFQATKYAFLLSLSIE